MNNSDHVKDQHYVPCFYLKNFSADNGYVHILNCRFQKLFKPKHYKSVGKSFYYYAQQTGIPDDISQIIEHWLGHIEDYLAKRLPLIIENILSNDPISKDYKYDLCILMSMLWLRTPHMREQLKSQKKQRDENIRKMIANTKYKYEAEPENNISHLMLLTESLGLWNKGFSNMFEAMNWRIYIIKFDKNFITTDSPVVEYWLPPKEFWGSSFLERDKYFALTPKILVKLTYPTNSDKIKRKSLFEKDAELIKYFNIILGENAVEYAYSNNEGLLSDLLQGRIEPGRLELRYIKEYAIPWREYNKNNL